jgi:hypothetical protein
MRIIIGMVSEPTVTVLAIELPEIMPNKPEAKMETFAGPPAKRPAMAVAISMKKRPSPTRVANTPNKT